MNIRLQKRISDLGYTSRRKGEDLIKRGLVKVNGEIVTELGFKVNGEDLIEVEGKVINQEIKYYYYLLNKPAGVIASTKDLKGRKTVTDLIDAPVRIYPVGRLDYDTTGALILTNDGELTNYLTHPSYMIKKTYLVKVKGIIGKDEIIKLKKGIIIDKKRVIPSHLKVKRKDYKNQISFVEITIHEGMYHVVKRMMEKVGLDVIKLHRKNIEFLDVKSLNGGEYRELSSNEVRKLYSLCKIQDDKDK